MGEKISIIVPIYNVEKYLNRCIESIVNQTYQNLEIILVDDGSPDQCSEICDQWALKDSRIKVIHKKNGGLSDARNKGMEIASGDYIGFVDSDDWLHKNALEILLLFMQESQVDIVECKSSSVERYVQDEIVLKNQIKSCRYSTETALSRLILEKPLKQTVWNKLYRRKLIEQIPFEVGKYHEDEYWTYQIFAKAKEILFIDVILYYYFQRCDSIMGNEFSMKRMDAIEGRYNRFKFLQTNYEKLEFIAKKNLFFLIIYYGQQALKSKENIEKVYFQKINKYLKEITFTKKEFYNVTWKEKIWIGFGKKHIKLVCKIRNWIKIGIN